MKRKLMYFLTNGVFVYLVYLAVFKGVVGAERLVIFVVCWFLIVSIAVCFPSELTQKLKEKGRAVPGWFDTFFDISIVAIFLWYGFVWTGIIYFGHWLFLTAAYKRETPQIKES